ncbi:hypothetical protein [Curtobacterium sp. RRHDQ10]|uniref:hypothetical protein n=1 Tax=Curtobacterium phyllosphaerae TaxID=3413379 RepID=UPI003BEF7352
MRPGSGRPAAAPSRPKSTAASPVRPATVTSARAGQDDFATLLRANTVDVAARGASRARRRRRSPLVGKISFGLAVVCIAVDASAFAVFMGGEMNFATGMCFVVVFLTLVAAVLGFVAAVGGLGRWYGVLAVLLAFIGNPVILVIVLAVVAPEATAQYGSGS